MPVTKPSDRLRRVTSRQNSLVKDIRAAFRAGGMTDDGLVAVEGFKLIEEALRSGVKLNALLFADSAAERAERLLAQVGRSVETLVVADDVFRSAVDSVTPQGVAALVRVPTHTLDSMLTSESPLLVVAYGLQDPGNLGTIIRSAEAFAAAGIIVADQTVSRFNPKAVRASAGSVFRLPAVASKFKDAAAQLRQRGIRLLGATSHHGKPAHACDLCGGCALIIGNEGAGLPQEVIKQLDERIAIPHAATVESLNAAIAASLLLYEAYRQRQT